MKPNQNSSIFPFIKGKNKSIVASIIALSLFGNTILPAHALVLYVDPETEQVYTSPGKNRVKLGKFKQVNSTEEKQTPEELRVLDSKLIELKAIEKRLDEQQEAIKIANMKSEEKAETPQLQAKKWYDRISIGGYTQFRQGAGLSGDFANLNSPGDKAIEKDTNFFIRRARLVFQGDVSDHLKLYMQTEFAGGDVAVRDMYGDIFFDKKKEFRIRPGLSKVPSSFELLQSSRDRLSLERADAVSSGVRNERDTGIFFYWTPEHIQKRFSFLRDGLKGSGDYGVIGFGAYTGQGLNQRDKNDNVHLAARVTYPFQFSNGQIFETGVFGYMGKFVPTVGKNAGASILDNPTFNKKGYRDERIGVHAVLYPQPFGFQSEWNWGQSPQLSADRTQIESGTINGGYVQAMYKIDNSWGTWIPYVKWQKYNGAEKDTTNTPFSRVRETEVGLEWQVNKQIELVAAYANMERTNVKTLHHVKNANIARLQLQWNY
ncbi:MAG: porin [Nitrosomonas sp.]|nr:porin [Nitrosomonas sp.]MDP1949863.1 porin [Nitrosomonas sp.]